MVLVGVFCCFCFCSLCYFTNCAHNAITMAMYIDIDLCVYIEKYRKRGRECEIEYSDDKRE